MFWFAEDNVLLTSCNRTSRLHSLCKGDSKVETKMDVSLNIILMLLNIANIMLHTSGTYLLYSVYKSYKKTPQQIFLINLSVCETLMNSIECLRCILEFVLLYGAPSTAIVETRHYLQIISLTGVSFIFYMDMLYITVDRLANILLNIYYPIYWNVTKTMYLSQVTWTLGMLVCVSTSIAHYVTDYNWKDLTFIYFYPTVDIIFIVLAVVTYTLIFRKYKKSVLKTCKNKKSVLKTCKYKKSVLKTCKNKEAVVAMPQDVECKQTDSLPSVNSFALFRRSRFYMPVLLILTFLLFTVVSDLTYLFYGLVADHESETLLAVCWMSYAVSNLADGFIYIFMHRHVKIVLRKKVKSLSCFLKLGQRSARNTARRNIEDGNVKRNTNNAGPATPYYHRKIAVVDISQELVDVGRRNIRNEQLKI